MDQILFWIIKWLFTIVLQIPDRQTFEEKLPRWVRNRRWVRKQWAWWFLDYKHISLAEGPFVQRVEVGRSDEVATFLDAGITADALSESGQPVLLIASSISNVEIARLLLDHGARPNEHDENGNTSLIVASSQCNEELVRLLLERGADPTYRQSELLVAAVNCRNRAIEELLVAALKKKGVAPNEMLMGARLLKAIEGNRSNDAIKLLSEGAPVNCRNLNKENPLMLAVESNQIEVVKALIVKRADPNACDGQGRTPLIIASELNHTPVAPILVKYLKEISASLDTKDREGKTALMKASERGHSEIVSLLIEAGAKVNETGPDDTTALILAAWKGKTESVRLLVDNGAEVDKADNSGRTALMGAIRGKFQEIHQILTQALAKEGVDLNSLLRAVGQGDVATVCALVKRGASPNIRDEAGNTPLILAAARGLDELVKVLIDDLGADVNARNDEGNSALMEAAKFGRTKVVEMIAGRVSIDAKNRAGNTALILVAANGRDDVVRLLLEKGAKVDEIGEGGATALVRACRYGALPVVEMLIGKGANVDAPAKLGYSPLMVAHLLGHTAIVNLLVAKNAQRGFREAELFIAARTGDESKINELLATKPSVSINAMDPEGRTGLMEAAERGYDRILKALIGAKADVNTPTIGPSALVLAAHRGWTDAVRVLIDNHAEPVTTALREAVKRGHAEVVRLILDETDVSADTRRGTDDSPLILAAAAGHSDVVRVLLDHNADLNLEGRNGNTALTIAIIEGHTDIAQMLIETGASAKIKEANLIHSAAKGDAVRVRTLLSLVGYPRITDRNGRTVLMIAAEKGHAAVVRILLEHLSSKLPGSPGPSGATTLAPGGKTAPPELPEVNERDRNDNTALMLATERKRAEVVKLLLEWHVEADARTVDHRTPLMEAAKVGSMPIVEMLVGSRQVDIDAEDSHGNTPLKEALIQGHDKIADYLRAQGATKGFEEAELLAAAEACDIDRLKALITQGADVNARGRSGRTALMLAAGHGCLEAIELLVDDGAYVDEHDNSGRTALHLSAAAGNDAIVETLLNYNADPNAESDAGITPLLVAAKSGHDSVVEKLITKGANVNTTNERGETALILAASSGHQAVVDKLIATKKLQLDGMDQGRRTALTWAHMEGYSGIELDLWEAGARHGLNEGKLITASAGGDEGQVSQLLQKGVDVSVRDPNDETALLKLARLGLSTTVLELINAGANVNAKNHKGRTALMEASTAGHDDVVEVLLEARANINTADATKNTALIDASRTGKDAVVHQLLSRARVNTGNREGETAMIAASGEGHVSVVRRLLEKNADLKAQTSQLRTAFMEAAEGGHLEILKLIHGGSDIDARDRKGHSALDLAVNRRHEACADFIRGLFPPGGPPPPPPDEMVYTTPTGEKYHLLTCTYLDEAREHNAIQSHPSATAAKAAGYDPCDNRCKPPG